MKEKILFAVRIENADWQEELITENEKQIPAAIEWAKENGFNRFRIFEFDPQVMPDFTKVINV